MLFNEQLNWIYHISVTCVTELIVNDTIYLPFIPPSALMIHSMNVWWEAPFVPCPQSKFNCLFYSSNGWLFFMSHSQFTWISWLMKLIWVDIWLFNLLQVNTCGLNLNFVSKLHNNLTAHPLPGANLQVLFPSLDRFKQSGCFGGSKNRMKKVECQCFYLYNVGKWRWKCNLNVSRGCVCSRKNRITCWIDMKINCRASVTSIDVCDVCVWQLHKLWTCELQMRWVMLHKEPPSTAGGR